VFEKEDKGLEPLFFTAMVAVLEDKRVITSEDVSKMTGMLTLVNHLEQSGLITMKEVSEKRKVIWEMVNCLAKARADNATKTTGLMMDIARFRKHLGDRVVDATLKTVFGGDPIQEVR